MTFLIKTCFLLHCCEVVVVKRLSGISELVEGHQQVVWRSTNNNTAWCAQPPCEPPPCSCYFLFCCVSLAGKHLVHTWTRDSDDLSVISGWMAGTWVPSRPRRLETKHILRQRELNLNTRHKFWISKAKDQPSVTATDQWALTTSQFFTSSVGM